MSKSVGRIFGSGNIGNYGYENNYINYLRRYDTSNYDLSQQNMSGQALAMSRNLQYMPDYQFSVQGSDAARQRAENATYQSYVDKLTPQYQQQTADMENSLINRGIPVGSAAYNRAMQNLYDSQNAALQQAAYQSVLSGQDAYTQSLRDSINTADFGNNAQRSYIDQIRALLADSVSGYENMANLYNTQQGIAARRQAAEESGWSHLRDIAKTAAAMKGISSPGGAGNK